MVNIVTGKLSPHGLAIKSQPAPSTPDEYLLSYVNSIYGTAAKTRITHGSDSFRYWLQTLKLESKAENTELVVSTSGADLFIPMVALHLISDATSQISEIPRSVIEFASAITIAYNVHHEAQRAKEHQREKLRHAYVKIAAAVGVGGFSFLKQLANAHALHGTTATVLGHAVAPLTAALCFYEAAHAHQEMRLAEKRQSGIYLLYDHLKRLQSIKASLKKAKDLAQKHELEHEQWRLQQQVDALYLVNRDTLLNLTDPLWHIYFNDQHHLQVTQQHELIEMLRSNQPAGQKHPLLARAECPKASAEQRELCQRLRHSQRSTARHHRALRRSYILAGIGMTVIAATTIFGLGTPLLVIGAVTCAVAATMKIVQAYKGRRVSDHRKAKKHLKRQHSAAMTKAVKKHYEAARQAGFGEICDYDQMYGVKAYIAYLHYRLEQPSLTHAAFLRHLRQMPMTQRQRLFNMATERYTQDQVLNQHFGHETEDGMPCTATRSLSNHDRQQLLLDIASNKVTHLPAATPQAHRNWADAHGEDRQSTTDEPREVETADHASLHALTHTNAGLLHHRQQAETTQPSPAATRDTGGNQPPILEAI